MTRNVAVRRSAYLESGGYGARGFAATEESRWQTCSPRRLEPRYLTEPVVPTADCGSLTD